MLFLACVNRLLVLRTPTMSFIMTCMTKLIIVNVISYTNQLKNTNIILNINTRRAIYV